MREIKLLLPEPGSVFQGYGVHRVETLEERLEDLDSLSLTVFHSVFAKFNFAKSFKTTTSFHEGQLIPAKHEFESLKVRNSRAAY